MKSTKKYLSTGVALAIALFAAVQTIAMESGRKVNPYLSPEIKQRAERAIKSYERMIDPKNKVYDEPFKKMLRQELKVYEDVLYGNKYYTWQEYHDTVRRHQERIGEENPAIRENQ